MRTVKLGSLAPGLNNRLEWTRLGRTLPDRSKATYLYAADNVDLSANSYLRRRRGFMGAITGDCHSVWGDGGEGYAVIDRVLSHLEPVALGQTPLIADLPPVALAYARAPDGWVYWSNGQQIGRLQGVQARPHITPTPSPAPTAAATAGALPAGRYQVAFTADGQDGESAATVPVVVDLPDGGGIAFSGMAAGMRVYATGPNGEIFNEVQGGAFLSLTNLGARAATILLAPMPPGRALAIYGGSLLVAVGNTVCVSEPYRYGLMNPSRGYIPFPAPVTVVQPCEDGVYVAADKTYWLAGDILDTTAATVLPFGALRGSSGFSPEQQFAWWQSPQGLVIAQPGGQVTTPQSDALAFGDAASGASWYRERDGMRHIVAARIDASPARAVSRGFRQSEIQRKACP
ncbi:hypothetical protein D3C87_1231640 [compost metagenome]